MRESERQRHVQHPQLKEGGRDGGREGGMDGERGLRGGVDGAEGVMD